MIFSFITAGNSLASGCVLHWISESDDGLCDALNMGFDRASGDLIGWLNVDEQYQPGILAV